MQNIKVGTPVYHYLNMGRVGIVVEVKTSTSNQVWLTEGTPSISKVALVRYSDGKEETHNFSDLMRADLD